MPISRKNQAGLDSTPYYHCISRSVRRAFLCGNDEFSGQSYEHRKQWVIDKLTELTDVFSIDVCAYTVMSNHYHLVLHINQPQALVGPDDDAMKRWTQLFKAVFVDRSNERRTSGHSRGKADYGTCAGMAQPFNRPGLVHALFK